MKEISIQDLKARLSAAVAEAESGHIILITRHNRPVARLTPATSRIPMWARNLRTSKLKPLLKQIRGSRYLTVLIEDRRGVDDV
jgi:prevent-host-death family protein